MPAPANIAYRAFLSYAHADTKVAKWFHQSLERFAIDRELVGRETAMGPVPRSLAPIFRDRDDFAGGNTLRDATVEAINRSASLIVICSPIAATRPAVNEEVRQFRARHPQRPVIPVIVDGTYPENFPPALRYELAPEGSVTSRPVTILGPDLRDSADGKFLGLAKTVAGLLGVGTDEIVRREQRRQRRRFRNWVAGLSTITILLAALTMIAEINRNSAQRRYALAADAAIDLMLLQTTLRYASTSSEVVRPDEFRMMLEDQKLNSQIFGRLRSEGLDWECRKIERLKLLVQYSSPLNPLISITLISSGHYNQEQLSIGWDTALENLRYRKEVPCPSDTQDGWRNTYSNALEAMEKFLKRL